ncbi:MAG: HD domain-containing protein [Patescibacteria group bacterium]|jgi:putative nucleotidyltransferase with HDIG domain
MNLPSRTDALKILDKWVKNPNLKKHMLAVEGVMRSYAKIFKEDEEYWGQVGLLHDFDYERYPVLKDHPFKGVEELKRLGYPENFLKAILAHAEHTGEPRNTLLKKAIFAVDELSGFIIAVALVRPTKKLSEVNIEAVMKKLKEKSFASKINREEIFKSAQELGIEFSEHINNVLNSLKSIHSELGL